MSGALDEEVMVYVDDTGEVTSLRAGTVSATAQEEEDGYYRYPTVTYNNEGKDGTHSTTLLWNAADYVAFVYGEGDDAVLVLIYEESGTYYYDFVAYYEASATFASDTKNLDVTVLSKMFASGYSTIYAVLIDGYALGRDDDTFVYADDDDLYLITVSGEPSSGYTYTAIEVDVDDVETETRSITIDDTTYPIAWGRRHS